jgi:hypothetical protein
MHGIPLLVDELRADVTTTTAIIPTVRLCRLWSARLVFWLLVGGAGGEPVGISRSWWRLGIRDAVGLVIRDALEDAQKRQLRNPI